ncbi:hypothetical protein HO133_001279 [Letharia lupina]|uniref:LDB19 N-terminal domain-containing protein n=1 Tax=Letharia lupina TaxID=560253 RepID=A0A8H6CEQ5_9LECA|nr:uncharacterized protein HO133_001279 [Letharia lupina]KAF6222193.1 hypothetical protein HO133_001279 [Letharia lupina]
MPMPTGIRGSIKSTKTSKSIKVNSHEIPDLEERRDSRTSPERKSSVGVMDFFNKEKRHSIGLGGKGSNTPAKGSPKNSPKLAPTKPAKLAIDMESPPLVFYGNPNQSTGALLSGQLLLTVTDPGIKLQNFQMTLIARVTNKRPITKDCPNCQVKDTDLFTWKFLTEPTHYKPGIHTFPFSYLLPGHLPATSHGELGHIDYVLDGRAVCAVSDTITVSRTLTVQRALPGSDKISVRVFPPTNLNVKVVIPSVIHPIGEFAVQMSMTGIIDNSLKNIQRRWRIRRMNWKIEENSKIISPACPKHTNKVGGEGKGILHEDTRSIGGDEMKDGWKTDYDTQGGEITLEFMAAIRPSSQPVCDVDSPTGLTVHHNLVLEIIVAEEQTTGKSTKGAMPTGSARVLRMQFKTTVTERAGMGISWDEEMPPIYEDVPSSPPVYAGMEDFVGDLPADESLEHMQR